MISRTLAQGVLALPVEGGVLGSLGTERFRVVYFDHLDREAFAMFRELVPPGMDFSCLSDADTESLPGSLADADALIVATRRVDGSVLDASPRLRLVQRQGVGLDNIDLDDLAFRGVRLAVAPVGSEAVAEHAILLMLACLRHLVAANQHTHAGEWPSQEFRSRSRSLRGLRVGLVGMGRIGREVAVRLAGWGAHLQYWGRTSLERREERRFGLRRLEFDELCASSDILSLHVPLSPATRHLVGEAQFRSMPRGAVIVNTSRGGIIDEVALARALSEGRLAGAGLDVLETESSGRDSPLVGRSDVLLSPHIAGAPRDVVLARMQRAFENIDRLRHGSPLWDEIVLDARAAPPGNSPGCTAGT